MCLSIASLWGLEPVEALSRFSDGFRTSDQRLIMCRWRRREDTRYCLLLDYPFDPSLMTFK